MVPDTDENDDAAWDGMLAELAARRAEFRELRYVPPDFVATLKKLGIFRAATPAMFGGRPLAPAEFLRMIERISVVDGSTGWVASFGSSQVYLAALPLDTQRELYRDGPDLVFAGGLFPVQPAPATERGFLVQGQWKFASGCVAADLLGVGIPGDETTSGKPRMALLRPDQVEIVPDWDVLGMRATGSFDLVVHGVEVPREWTFIRGAAPTVDEPIFRYPTIAYASQVLAIVNAGVARAALELAVAAGRRTGVTGAPGLADRAYYRAAIARAEAELRSARAWFYEAAETAWGEVLAGEEVGDERNAELRLSCAHLARTGASVVNQVVEVSGMAATQREHPLQWLLADALVPPQHAFLGPAMFDAAGAVFLGRPPTVPGFR